MQITGQNTSACIDAEKVSDFKSFNNACRVYDNDAFIYKASQSYHKLSGRHFWAKHGFMILKCMKADCASNEIFLSLKNCIV